MPKIIPAMQMMGYKPDPNGVCFGLAAMSAKAIIRKDAQSFAKRIALIHNSDDTFPYTIKKDKQLELQSFFDELSVYQGPGSHPEFSTIFPELQQNIANLELLTPYNELVSYNLLKEEEKVLVALPKTKIKFVNNFAFNEFTAFIQQTTKFLNREPFSLLISESAVNHSIQLGFDGTNWLLTDHDKIEICNNTESDIQNLILKFFQKSSDNENRKTLSVSIVLSNFSQTNLAKLDNYDFDIDLVTHEFDKNIIFELLLNFQRSDKVALTSALIDKINYIDPTYHLFLEALEFQDNYGQTVLFRTIANGQSELLDLIIEKIENSNLTGITKARLLTVKDDEERSGFYYAVSGGYINVVSAILNAMNKAQLHSQIENIISAQSVDGTSSIHMAVLSRCTKMIELLLKAIDELNICEEKKFNLITAKTHEEVSALHMAAYEGRFDMVELLLSAIENKNVLEKNKLTWIALPTLDGRNALSLAANKGSVAVAKRLFKAIDECSLDIDIKKQYKRSLIDAKSEKGMSASTTAARCGHVGFFRYIMDMYKQFYENTTISILNLLAQKQIEGASAIFLAAEYDHEEMISFLTKTVMALNISDLHKAKLIEAKRYDGASALSLAAQNCRSEAVNTILKAIVNLPSSEKFRIIDARNRHNTSALLLAVDKGDMATVKALVDCILSSNLTIHAKTILLTSASPTPDKKSAYQHALDKNYQQIADYLKVAILKNTSEKESTLSTAAKGGAKRSFAVVSDDNGNIAD